MGLLILYIIRDLVFKRIFLRDSVLNKDRMDVNCIFYLLIERVLNYLEIIDRVVYFVVFDIYKISDIKKVGLYFYLIVICNGEYGKFFVFNYVLIKNFIS